MKLTVQDIMEMERKFRDMPPPKPATHFIASTEDEAEYFRKRGITVYMKKKI